MMHLIKNFRLSAFLNFKAVIRGANPPLVQAHLQAKVLDLLLQLIRQSDPNNLVSDILVPENIQILAESN